MLLWENIPDLEFDEFSNCKLEIVSEGRLTNFCAHNLGAALLSL